MAAAARGETVQGLVGGLLERFLVEEGRKPPALGPVLGKLRAHATELKAHGMTALWVFGSVARGTARADSDIDLFAEFNSKARLSLVGLASLRAELSELLGSSADLVERSALHASVRESAEREAVRVL
ncbi:nucleotidyltransferase family protein [Lichenicoccus sp.]|uniref:nucleotidyltransferase family protein n=1 Tax=Lichenicoccus sp. TaxID=2781899 RepID=UPI003D0BB4CE